MKAIHYILFNLSFFKIFVFSSEKETPDVLMTEFLEFCFGPKHLDNFIEFIKIDLPVTC